ncbi:DNA-binding MarR family transcriptional regulator [Nakamurella sp. UYEF19]|uniref:ArsR/SmtB family transcription factor n=1 Tax=Nakamurella sp. UYEF19 TaxID=1756392 RepID=UPI003397D479
MTEPGGPATSQPGSPGSNQRRAATDQEAKALASSLRLRMLRICLGESHTNSEIAQILHLEPGNTLHHVRTLVRAGFLEAQAERRGARGAREIPYLATRKSWRLSTPPQDQLMLDTFLEEIALVPEADVNTARLGLRLPPADMEEFRAQLQHLLDDFASRPDDPAAPAWSVFLSVHPDPNRP